MTNKEMIPYEKLRKLLESLDGSMKWQSGGAGGGGVYVLELWGETLTEPARNTEVNRLDKLYVAKVDNPKTWGDYDYDEPELVEGVHWKLVALFLQQREGL